MKKIILLPAIILLIAISIMWSKRSFTLNQTLDNNNAFEPANGSHAFSCVDADPPCPEGYICFASWSCPRGKDCSIEEITGDFLCHQECEDNSDCPDHMPMCKEMDIYRGDIVESKKLCVQ